MAGFQARRQASGFVAAGLGLALAAYPARAHAQSPLAQLQVTRDEGTSQCPDAPALAQSVSRMMGHRALDPSPQNDSDTRIRVHISKTPLGYRAEVVLQGAHSGRRELSDDNGDNCRDLTDALTLTLALILDNFADEKPHTPAAWMPPPTREHRRPWHLALGASAGAGFGLPHGAAPLLEGELAVQSPFWLSLHPGAFWTPSQKLDYAQGKVQLSLKALWLPVCARLWGDESELNVRLCALPAAGVLSGQGQGYDRDRSVSRFWSALGAGSSALFPLTKGLSLVGRAAVLVPLQSQKFAIEGAGIAYSPSQAGFFITGGLQASIW